MRRIERLLTIALLAAACPPALARQASIAAPGPRTELSKTGEPHKRLAALVGTWFFTGRHVFSDGTKPVEFKGTLVRKPIWDGRYFVAETTGGQFPMLWSDGKPVTYREMTIEGYDNVTRKYVTAFMHNEIDTDILTFRGDFDPATATFTYEAETSSHLHQGLVPGTRFRFENVVKIVDRDHDTLVWREIVDGKEEVRTELANSRTKDT